MNDIYTESIVPITRTAKERAKTILLFLLTLFSFILYLFIDIMMIPTLLFGYLFYRNPFHAKRMYEYIHVNDSFDIDMVTRSRKHLCTVDLNHVVLVAPTTASSASAYGHLKAVNYSGVAPSDATHIMVHKNNGKQQKLLLSLDPKMYDSLRCRIPHAMK